MQRNRQPSWLSSAGQMASRVQSTGQLRSKSSIRYLRSLLMQSLKVHTCRHTARQSRGSGIWVLAYAQVTGRNQFLSGGTGANTVSSSEYFGKRCCQHWRVCVCVCRYQLCLRRTTGPQRKWPSLRNMRPWAFCTAGARWTSSSTELFLWCPSTWRSAPCRTASALGSHRWQLAQQSPKQVQQPNC